MILRQMIMVVDDDSLMAEALATALSELDYQTRVYLDPQSALIEMEKNGQYYGIAILDQKMPGMDGIELLKRFRELNPEIQIVLMTAYGTVETAVKAMKLGALDYISKPFDITNLKLVVERAEKYRILINEKSRLLAEVQEKYSLGRMIGRSKIIREVFDLIPRVAVTDSTVLIMGPSGTGKELVANSLHYNSLRASGPFLKVNCGAIPDNLLESELFGHEKGAFTGAVSARKGRFEQADGGTIFLDEIGELPVNLQSKLLRVLQDRTIEKIGGRIHQEVDVRILAATNRDLEAEVEAGNFRDDLYWRLNVIPIVLPSLKDRLEDLPLLIDHFLKKFSNRFKKSIPEIGPEVMDCFLSYHWPGNIRELENYIERIMVLSTRDRILKSDLPSVLQKSTVDNLPDQKSSEENSENFSGLFKLEDVEKAHIRKVLVYSDGNISKASRLLGIDRKTLYSKVKKYKINVN